MMAIHHLGFFKADHSFSPCFLLLVLFSVGLHFMSESFSRAFLSFNFQGETMYFIIYYIII